MSQQWRTEWGVSKILLKDYSENYWWCLDRKTVRNCTFWPIVTSYSGLVTRLVTLFVERILHLVTMATVAHRELSLQPRLLFPTKTIVQFPVCDQDNRQSLQTQDTTYVKIIGIGVDIIEAFGCTITVVGWVGWWTGLNCTENAIHSFTRIS